MNDGYLTTFADLLAEWGHDPCCSLKTCLGCCLQTTGTLWPESFMDWPASGITSDGGLFQQPLLEPRIGETAGGVLLGTPRAINLPPAVNHLADGGSHKGKLENQVYLLDKLLPTPMAHDMKENASPSRLNRQTPGLGAINMLLPTPTASQPGGTAEQHLARKNKDGGNRKTVTDLGMVVSHLLPTPRAQNGEDRNNKIYPRPMDQPQNLENALARLPNDSDPTQEQSDGGSVSWEEQHLIPPSTDD